MKKNNRKNRMMAYAIIALVAIIIFGPLVACMKDNYSKEKEAALVNNNTIEQSETTTEKNDQASCEEKVAEVKAQYEEKLRALEAEIEAYKVQKESPFEQWPYSEIEFDSNGKVVRVKSMEAVEALITIQKDDKTAVYRLGDGNKCEVTEEVNVKTKKYWDNEFDLAHKWSIIVGKTANGELRYINAGRVNSNNEFYSYNWGQGCKAAKGYAYQVTDKMGNLGDLPSSFQKALRWYEDESSPVGVTFCLDYTENVYVAPVTQPEKPVVKPTPKPEVDNDDDEDPVERPENNPDPKPEDKPDPKPEDKPDPKPEDKPDPKPENNPDPEKPEDMEDQKPESEPENNPDPEKPADMENGEESNKPEGPTDMENGSESNEPADIENGNESNEPEGPADMADNNPLPEESSEAPADIEEVKVVVSDIETETEVESSSEGPADM